MKKYLLLSIIFFGCLTDNEKDDPKISTGQYHRSFEMNGNSHNVLVDLQPGGNFEMTVTTSGVIFMEDAGTWNQIGNYLCIESSLSSTCDSLRNISAQSFETFEKDENIWIIWSKK